MNQDDLAKQLTARAAEMTSRYAEYQFFMDRFNLTGSGHHLRMAKRAWKSHQKLVPAKWNKWWVK